mmetsp:Transcript_24016/g.69089  ORF Transcript_24016/g.69089 Transcript_24016/m.69089 type:complete len:222 (-) Transcript_24016:345-1010(-)
MASITSEMCVDRLSTFAVALSSAVFDTTSARLSICSASSADRSAILLEQPASQARKRSSTLARILVSNISSLTLIAASKDALFASAFASNQTLSILTSMCACNAFTPSSAALVSLRERSSTSRTTDDTAFSLPSTSWDHFSRETSAALCAASWTLAFKETSASRVLACTVSVASHKSAFARSKELNKAVCSSTVADNEVNSSCSLCMPVAMLNSSWSAQAR